MMRTIQFESEHNYNIQALPVPGDPEWTKTDLFYHFDPFAAECRAYGRLKEVGKEHLAVRCHGYLILNARQKRQLNKFLEESGDLYFYSDAFLDAEDPFTGLTRYRKDPIRALVKDYVDSKIDFLPHMIPQMMRDIHTYHKYGICIADIKENNYLDGILFDLSRALTVPHPQLTPRAIERARSKTKTEDTPTGDYQSFDHMIDDWNEDHADQFIWHRFLPSLGYVEKLRGSERWGKGLCIDWHRKCQEIVYYRPELYKWEKPEKK